MPLRPFSAQVPAGSAPSVLPTLLSPRVGPMATTPKRRSDAAEIARTVARLLAQMHPPAVHEKRRDKRVPIPCLFRLTPAQADDRPEIETPMIVVGKDISPRGIGFFHEHPIPYRRGLLTVELPSSDTIEIEVELLWCRFTSQGWYESGGRIRGVSGE